jgi:hypothetical protein
MVEGREPERLAPSGTGFLRARRYSAGTPIHAIAAALRLELFSSKHGVLNACG